MEIVKKKKSNTQKPDIFQKIWKNLFFLQKYQNFERFFFAKQGEKKIYAILLVLLIEDISPRPELSSPPRLRIHGGSSERHKEG